MLYLRYFSIRHISYKFQVCFVIWIQYKSKMNKLNIVIYKIYIEYFTRSGEREKKTCIFLYLILLFNFLLNRWSFVNFILIRDIILYLYPPYKRFHSSLFYSRWNIPWLRFIIGYKRITYVLELGLLFC